MTDLPNAHVDFETFSELTIKGPKSVGAQKYFRHPSTEIQCMGWAIGDEDSGLWLPGDPPPQRLVKHIKRGGLVWAWNAEFEIPGWEFILVERFGWPEIPFSQWRDSAALALTFGLPAALGDAGHALGLEVVKNKRGQHLINKLCKPRKPSKHDPSTRWTPENTPQDYVDFYEYCRQDVRSERAMHDALPCCDFTASELKTWRMTVEMNARGWQVDLTSTKRMIALMEKHRVDALSELQALTGGKVQTANQLEKLRAWLRGRGVDLPNLQADTVEAALRELSRPGRSDRRSRRVLEIRQVLSHAATNKYAAQLRLADHQGVVRNLLMYHGAHTGRDAGRGIQIQNYLRDSISKTEAGVELAIDVVHSDDPIPVIECLYASVPEFAALLTRSMLTAAPGKVLYSGDFSGIENRLAAWYAGCEYALEIFRQGMDEYRIFGSRYYGVDSDDVTDKQRNHSKRAVLSFIYGSGWETFMRKCEEEKAPCTEKVAKETVSVYRKKLYPEVVSMWYDLERAAKAAVMKPGRIARVRRPYAEVRFQVRGKFLFMKLASGRELAYYRPLIQKRRAPWGEMKDTIIYMGASKVGWRHEALIPGTVFNHVVQGTARDVMMAGAHAVIAAGYELVGRVHDELINQMPIGTGDLNEYLEFMCPDLGWLQGVPITAKGWTGHRYRK